mgnify:CR=1 FL=1|jgi:hypothetical protein
MGMRINLLKKQNYRSMPWRNGKGFTSEIAIFPTQSTAVENNFSWRLSSADVVENGLFSYFPNCHRYLAIIDGQGLNLRFENEKKLITQNSFIHFSGEEKVHCELINGKVKDLNLIVKKNAHHIQFEILNTTVNGLLKGTSIIFVIEGLVQVKQYQAEKFDTLIIEAEQNENDISIQPGTNSKFVLITIS